MIYLKSTHGSKPRLLFGVMLERRMMEVLQEKGIRKCPLQTDINDKALESKRQTS